MGHIEKKEGGGDYRKVCSLRFVKDESAILYAFAAAYDAFKLDLETYLPNRLRDGLLCGGLNELMAESRAWKSPTGRIYRRTQDIAKLLVACVRIT